MLTHTNIIATLKSIVERRSRAKLPTVSMDRHCSFLPMAHLYERMLLIFYFAHGSQVAYCPTPEKVFDYYAIIQPTAVSTVPRILNKVYDVIMTEVNKSKLKRFLISQALHNEKS